MTTIVEIGRFARARMQQHPDLMYHGVIVGSDGGEFALLQNPITNDQVLCFTDGLVLLDDKGLSPETFEAVLTLRQKLFFQELSSFDVLVHSVIEEWAASRKGASLVAILNGVHSLNQQLPRTSVEDVSVFLETLESDARSLREDLLAALKAQHR